MFPQLLQHVVEEAEAGSDHGLRGAIEVDGDLDAGFPGLAFEPGHSRRIDQKMCDLGPGKVLRAEPETANAQVPRELHVGVAVADHGGAFEVDRTIAEVVHHHADARLSRGPMVSGQALVEEDLAEPETLRIEDLKQQFLRAEESLTGKTRGAETVLIAHHHELEAGIAEPDEGGYDAFHQPELLVGVDLLVLGLLDENAVAVDEENAGHGWGASRRAAITAWFSSGVPTEMRRASSSWGMARRSRTTTPRASRC